MAKSNKVQVDSRVEEVKLKMRGALNAAAEMIGGLIEGHAKELCPVDTGLLRNSIMHGKGGQYVTKRYSASRPDKDGIIQKGSYAHQFPPDEDFKTTVYVGTNVVYAPWVELGHNQTPGRYVPAIGKRLKASYVVGKPFLRPAWENHSDEFQQAIHEALVKYGVDK